MNPSPPQRPLSSQAWMQPGIFFAVLAMASLSFSDVTSKWVMLSVTPVMVLWFRYVVQALGTALVLAPLRGRAMWRTHSLRWQLLRGLLMVTCSLLAFYCLQRMPVAEFTATVMLTPLALTALARFVMKEQVSKLRWLMVVGGLIGAMLVIRPGGQVDPSVGWMALTVVLTYAVFQAVTSHMTRTEDPAVMQLYTGWVGWAVSTLLVANAWVTPQSLHEWTLLLVVGLAATLGQYLLIVAFSKAPASVVSPFLYTGVGFSTLMGWWLFDHMPDALAFTGMGLVVLCGVLSGRIQGRGKP
ncbi:DMT family transporter [Limnohabitans sp. Rim8]|uniref:DMT family transporter n=1 Tax=Limnohabitans sp. Rim8 TaxID=1100718 RepID=UPI0025EADFBE|nr:DMT family transporter [Limnohabitans sp. Rim8]